MSFVFILLLKILGLRRNLLIFVSLFYCSCVFAQRTDSLLKRTSISGYFREKGFYPGRTILEPMDTALTGIQNYFPNNFPYSFGLAARSLVFRPTTSLGFQTGFNDLNLFSYNRDQILYYNTRAPYTDLYVIFGAKKEQFSHILHTQNITKQFNIAMNMLRIRSGQGYYQSQTGSDNNLSLSLAYHTKNNRYCILANGIATSIKADENGGIVKDSIYENNLLEDKRLVPVNLTNARSKRGTREL